MSTIYQWICRTASLGIISVGLVAIACSDLPSGFGWEHTYPEAMVIRENHTIRVEVDQDGGVVGALDVGEGSLSGQLEVIFLDEAGTNIRPSDDEYLEVTITFTDLAVFEHDSPGSFTGRIRGMKAGETSAFFKFKGGRVGSGMGQWTSPPIPVSVRP